MSVFTKTDDNIQYSVLERRIVSFVKLPTIDIMDPRVWSKASRGNEAAALERGDVASLPQQQDDDDDDDLMGLRQRDDQDRVTLAHPQRKKGMKTR